MKKPIALLIIFGLLIFGISNAIFAQDASQTAAIEQTTGTISAQIAPIEVPVLTKTDADEISEQSFHYVLKDKFIQGGAMWMTPILFCLILGLAFSIERILYLNLANINSAKLLDKLEEALNSGGVAKAKQLCADTKGPLAGIFYEGLDRYDEGFESIEKAVESYGGVQMGKLETNLSWIGLFISMAPSLGFLGTVVGMVQAFDDIERAGDISPTIVAGGMKVALLTTVFGLIVALTLQVFYSYILSKIDHIVNNMEDATIAFMDILIKNKQINQRKIL